MVDEINIKEQFDLPKETIYENDSYNGNKNRRRQASKTEFWLSSIGYTIGLGNIWRFPILCYRHGGGTFLLAYFLMLLTCGIPMYFLEMGIGQFSSLGCVGVFRLVPLLKGAGLAMLVINFLSTCYYSVILSYPIYYGLSLFNMSLPWMSCDNVWNTLECFDVRKQDQLNFAYHNASKNLAAEEFFHNQVLHISSGVGNLGGIVWPLFACLALSWIVIYFCVVKSSKNFRKVVYFTATFSYLLLIVLLVRCITLPGAEYGILHYVTPNWSRLFDINVWSDAAVQVFFSLGLGWGTIVHMSSFNTFRNNIKHDALLVPIMNCWTNAMAGLVVYSVLGFLAYQTGMSVIFAATNGPGLVFLTYPVAMAMLPWPHLWLFLIFLMIFLCGLTTVFVQIRTIGACILDEIPRMRNSNYLVPTVLCSSMFLISIVMVTKGGFYVLYLLDWYFISIPLLLICFFEVIMVSWIYGMNNFVNDMYFMIGSRPYVILIFCLKYITPLILLVLFLSSIIFNEHISYGSMVYHDWEVSIGWCGCIVSVVCIPVYILFVVFSKPGPFIKKLTLNLQPQNWTPAQEELRQQYEIFKNAQNRIPRRKKMYSSKHIEMIQPTSA